MDPVAVGFLNLEHGDQKKGKIQDHGGDTADQPAFQLLFVMGKDIPGKQSQIEEYQGKHGIIVGAGGQKAEKGEIDPVSPARRDKQLIAEYPCQDGERAGPDVHADFCGFLQHKRVQKHNGKIKKHGFLAVIFFDKDRAGPQQNQRCRKRKQAGHKNVLSGEDGKRADHVIIQKRGGIVEHLIKEFRPAAAAPVHGIKFIEINGMMRTGGYGHNGKNSYYKYFPGEFDQFLFHEETSF